VPFTITSITDSLTEAIAKLKTETMNRWSHQNVEAWGRAFVLDREKELRVAPSRFNYVREAQSEKEAERSSQK
jgi:hypothetical protein